MPEPQAFEHSNCAPDRPTGFVSSNELTAPGAIRTCRDLPVEDFARCGFVSRDGTNLFGYLQPPAPASTSRCSKAAVKSPLTWCPSSMARHQTAFPICGAQTLSRDTSVVIAIRGCPMHPVRELLEAEALRGATRRKLLLSLQPSSVSRAARKCARGRTWPVHCQ